MKHCLQVMVPSLVSNLEAMMFQFHQVDSTLAEGFSVGWMKLKSSGGATYMLGQVKSSQGTLLCLVAVRSCVHCG